MSAHLEPSADVLDEMVDTRRHLHAHPEVSFDEHDTSRFIEARLREIGLDVRECPTDTDALPIREESGVAFSSAHEGRMHACGHDAHTAILLGAARALANRAEELRGSYLFCFQPAEEIVSGAREMIARGLFDRHHPD